MRLYFFANIVVNVAAKNSFGVSPVAIWCHCRQFAMIGDWPCGHLSMVVTRQCLLWLIDWKRRVASTSYFSFDESYTSSSSALVLITILSVCCRYFACLCSTWRVFLVIPYFLVALFLALRLEFLRSANIVWWSAWKCGQGAPLYRQLGCSQTSVRHIWKYLFFLHDTLCDPWCMLTAHYRRFPLPFPCPLHVFLPVQACYCQFASRCPWWRPPHWWVYSSFVHWYSIM